MKDGTVIMGVTSDMLREHGYAEWDGTQGSMIGAAYDWRITPPQLESRDRFFTDMMEQTEAMVAADPEHRPAAVIGFSLGCRIAKYFLHFCHAKRGEAWMTAHVQELVALGGPFLGAVALTRAVMVDGTFPPLDLLFTESQMLTILRSVPVGQYLQPTGNWIDGMDMPFLFVREQMYFTVAIGAIRNDCEQDAAGFQASQLWVQHGNARVDCRHAVQFHNQSPFTESVTFAVDAHAASMPLQVGLKTPAGVAVAEHVCAVSWDSNGSGPFISVGDSGEQGAEQTELALIETATSQRLATVTLAVGVASSEALSTWDSAVLPTLDHPLSRHRGGRHTGISTCCARKDNDQTDNVSSGQTFTERVASRFADAAKGTASMVSKVISGHMKHEMQWSPARALALRQFEGMHKQPDSSWKVPAPGGELLDDDAAPPVSKVTCIYGVNTPTARTLFLKHQPVLCRGGLLDKLTAKYQLDPDGDVDGLVCVDGVGYETSSVAQVQPDTGMQVYLSGDGTVPYYSLRFPATWADESRQVDMFELPECDHRGASSDARMLKLLRGLLGLCDSEATDEIEGEVGKVSQAAATRLGDGTRYLSGMTPCRVVAKIGPRAFGVYRARFSLLVNLLASASLLICVFILVFGVSEDYNFLTACSWATATFDVENYGTLSFKQEFWLGIFTYAHTGDAKVRETTYMQTADLHMYMNDATCSTDFVQGSSELVLNYGRYLGNIFAFADPDVSVLFAGNCLASNFVINDVGGFDSIPNIHWDYNGTFVSGACTAVTYRSTGGMDITFSFRLTCGAVYTDLSNEGWYSPTVYALTDGYDISALVAASEAAAVEDTLEPFEVISAFGIIQLANGGSYTFSDGVNSKTFHSVSCNSAGNLNLLNSDGSTAYSGPATSCVDTSDGATDTDGEGCAAYTDPSECGDYDDDDFRASEMCCSCGGGRTDPGISFDFSSFELDFYCREPEESAPATRLIGWKPYTDSPLPLDGYYECVYNFDSCLHLDGEDDTSSSWKTHAHGCTKGLERDMCKSCAQSANTVYFITVGTCALQLPLVLLTRLRTSPLSDTRLRKFAVLVFGVVVIVGAAVASEGWYSECFQKLAPKIRSVAVRYGFSDVGSSTINIAWLSFSLIIAGLLALLVLVLNLVMPVPELYTYQCIDPEVTEPLPNSLSAYDSSDFHTASEMTDPDLELDGVRLDVFDDRRARPAPG